jgi:hypothetical protein
MEQEVYKVVKIYGSRPCSVWVFQNSEFFVEYLLGEWVDAPEGTLLFAFENLRDAKQYAVGVASHAIYKAVGRDPSSLDLCTSIGFISDDRDIKRFWRAVANRLPVVSFMNTP